MAVTGSYPVACLLALTLTAGACARPTIAIQPFTGFDSSLTAAARSAIVKAFDSASVTVLPAQPLPRSAWYAPRSRYRADSLLRWLDSVAGTSYTRIIGLTHKDISATKDTIPDWGLFGLGALAGKACVVSTFRLRRNATAEVLRRRFVDVVVHELGHTFGLDHCPVVGCIMEDARGTIKTVDRSTGTFCESCRKLLGIALESF